MSAIKYFFNLSITIVLLSLTAGCASDTEEKSEESSSEEVIIDEKDRAIEKYLGMLHPPVAQDLTKLGGALAKAPGQEAVDAEYSFTDVIDAGRRILWLSRLLERNEQGEVTWEVIDVAELPEISAYEEFLIHACTRNNGDAVAAIAKSSSEKEQLTDIVKAWAIDRNAGKLIEISGDDVTCENEGLHAP